MSKITPKNLHYDSSLPPFLARLQANTNSRDGRHEFSIARPKKAPRDPDEEAEDEPVYFDEASGETLTKRQWEAKDQEDAEAEAKAEGDAADRVNPDDADPARIKAGSGKEKEKERENLAGIGATKKRKAGKVVGADDEDDDGSEAAALKKPSSSQHVPVDTGKSDALKKTGAKASKPVKKGKKIKLSFDDE